jgi:hypothetical protein
MGDVVVVVPDGWVWGRLEGYPLFLKVDLPGVSVEDARFLTEIHFEDPEDISSNHLFRREWGILANRITPPILADITAAYEANEPYVVSNPDDILNWIRRKLDNAPPAWGSK